MEKWDRKPKEVITVSHLFCKPTPTSLEICIYVCLKLKDIALAENRNMILLCHFI